MHCICFSPAFVSFDEIVEILDFVYSKQYFFNILFKVDLTFVPIGWNLKVILSCSAVYYATIGVLTLESFGMNPKVWPLKWKPFRGQYFSSVVLYIMPYKVVLTFESVVEILQCDYSNESYWAVLSCGAVYYAVQGNSNFWVCGWNPKVWPFK